MSLKPPVVSEQRALSPEKIGPHLGLLDGETGTWTGIPVGSGMAIIIDPTNPTKVLPLVLVEVKLNKLTFKCACGQRACTRLYRFNATMTGNHPAISRG